MTTYLKRSVDDVIEWSRNQISNPSQNWSNMCQSHVRQAMGVGAWNGSAKGAWQSIPHNERHAGGRPSDAPRGAAIYFDSGTYGHVAIAIGKSTNDKCLSNDYKRQGQIDEAPRDFPRWGLHYAGWSFWTPFGELRPDGPEELWDGQVPEYGGILNAEADPALRNPAAWRLACRLADLGFFSGTPVKGVQGYPVKSMVAYNDRYAPNMEDPSKYGPKAHERIFG